jgi:hypothetical protein
MHVLKLTLGKIIISANFPLFSAFRCEAPRRAWLTIQTHAVLSIASQASGPSGRVGNMSGRDPYRFLSVACFLCHSHTTAFFYFFIMSCCVFFSHISPDILAFSAHLFSFHDILCVFPCSFKFLYFLEYWNICLLQYFLEILCMKILFLLCVGWILIYPCCLNYYICLCISGIQLTALIIPHCF